MSFVYVDEQPSSSGLPPPAQLQSCTLFLRFPVSVITSEFTVKEFYSDFFVKYLTSLGPFMSQDAARKALEQALGGYAKGKDILADNDPTPGTEVGGGGGNKGGFFSGWGGGGGGGNDGPSKFLE